MAYIETNPLNILNHELAVLNNAIIRSKCPLEISKFVGDINHIKAQIDLIKFEEGGN